MGLIGDIFQGSNAANAAHQAANTQATAAKNAQTLEQQNQQNALNFQNQAYDTTKQNEQPYLNLGQNSANSLNGLLQQGFQAPTLAQAQQNPGYQFALQQGTNALEKGAAARGNLLSGSEGTALQQYGQGLGEQNYQQVFNNALQGYQTNLQGLQGGTNTGLQSAGQEGQLGQQAAFNTGQLDLTGGAQQAQQINNAAAARASGYVGGANAWNSAINNANSQMTQAAALFAGA